MSYKGGNGESGGSASARSAFLGLGSNIGDRRQILRNAVAGLADVFSISSVFETAPVGGPAQDSYYNIVVKLDTVDTPRRLLERCHELEAAAGRERLVRWGPRTLDVDVLLVEESVDDGDENKAAPKTIDGYLLVDEPDLVVPHPRMAIRNFVVAPLLEIAPELRGHPFLDLPTGEERVGEVESLGPL